MRKIYKRMNLQTFSKKIVEKLAVGSLSCVGSSLLLSSCASVVPQTMHTPLLTQRGQAEVVAAAGFHGMGIQAAYAATDHLAITVSGQQRIRNHKGHWAYAGEVGAGRLWHRPSSHHWAMYGGLGYGAGYANKGRGFIRLDDLLSTSDRIRYNYAYIQPTYALIEGNYGLTLAVKISQYHFTRWRQSSSYLERREINDSTLVFDTRVETVNVPARSMTLVQPGVNFYFGLGGRLRFLLTSSIAVPLQQQVPQVAALACGFGVQYRLGGPKE
jgi:hypothetical protein